MRLIAEYLPFLAQPNMLSMLIRSIIAIICAGIIGYDRNVTGSPAGIRTHILVCVGAMLAMSTGEFVSLFYNADAERIAAQVVSGVGFLGAGTIIVHQGRISGLTTAAGLWASACIGLAIGTGFYEGALVGTAAVFITERFLRGWSKNISIQHSEPSDDLSIRDNSSED